MNLKTTLKSFFFFFNILSNPKGWKEMYIWDSWSSWTLKDQTDPHFYDRLPTYLISTNACASLLLLDHTFQSLLRIKVWLVIMDWVNRTD